MPEGGAAAIEIFGFYRLKTICLAIGQGVNTKRQRVIGNSDFL